jgi:hypothetical protein
MTHGLMFDVRPVVMSAMAVVRFVVCVLIHIYLHRVRSSIIKRGIDAAPQRIHTIVGSRYAGLSRQRGA